MADLGQYPWRHFIFLRPELLPYSNVEATGAQRLVDRDTYWRAVRGSNVRLKAITAPLQASWRSQRHSRQPRRSSLRVLRRLCPAS
jgi:hypothetical protein